MKLVLHGVCILVILSCYEAWGKGTKDFGSVTFPLEWHLWKSDHGKSYGNLKEELSKHLVWLGNKEYINQHNKYSHVFGYTLKMNHLGDMVRNLSISGVGSSVTTWKQA